MMSLVHKNMIIRGRVQGVFFRATALEVAKQYGIKGIIKNEPDGSVSIQAEGEEGNMKSFIEWCWKGPPSARVTRVGVSDGELQHYPDFKIAR